MFIANYNLKSAVQKSMMLLRLPVDFAVLHPYRALQERALRETMDFIVAEMPEAVAFNTPKELMAHALKGIAKTGLVAEFGVNSGGSINFIAGHLRKRPIHGFDSFEGLPEDWSGNQMARGFFSRKGRMPKVASNVALHRGWFCDTLPKFAAENDEPVALLHVDCDIYSSTVTIFEHLGSRLVPGSLVLFDEYFNYPAWQMHEHKAFREFLARSGRHCSYIAYSYSQVLCVMR